MPADNHELLEAMKRELQFLETGGYQNALSAQWRPQFIFEDSPTCLNFHRTKEPRPCHECVLASFVAPDCLGEQFPCRHIPLNEEGFTLDTYYRLGTFEEAEAAVRNWLRKKIQELEQKRDAANAAEA